MNLFMSNHFVDLYFGNLQQLWKSHTLIIIRVEDREGFVDIFFCEIELRFHQSEISYKFSQTCFPIPICVISGVEKSLDILSWSLHAKSQTN